MENKTNWPEEVRLEMVEKSEFYEHPLLYQFGYYDGYQKASQQTAPLLKRIEELENGLREIRAGALTGELTRPNINELANKLLNP